MAETDAPMADPSNALSEWQNALADARTALAAWKQDVERAVAPFQAAEDPAGPGLDDAVTDAEVQLSQILGHFQRAYSTLMTSYEGAVAAQTGDARQRLEWQRAEQARTHRTQHAQIFDEGQVTIVTAQASAARALFDAATREWNQPRDCRSCGDVIVVGAVWRPTTFTCGSCGDKNTYEPAPATERFYDGPSLNAICAEQALSEWRTLRDAQRRYQSLAHPLPADFEMFQEAAQEWAQAQARLHGELHPAWDDDMVVRETEKRAADALGEAASSDAAATRQRFAEGANVAAGGDLTKLMQWAQSHPETAGMADLVSQLAVCIHEHGDRTVAWQVIALQHHVQRETQDRDDWMRDRLAALDSALALR
ncbi:MAG TPA: hypothetical protein DFR83_10845 [Deltaproteobacteria bacterium]|nr:hypothetical protein [Deltaproteobacteria bacterium]